MSQSYNVFLSWSGPHAKQIAHVLRDWIPDICRNAVCWMSSDDIEKGAVGEIEIDNRLADSQTAIVILTPHSINSHWVLFEAGALSNGLSKNAVCTLLCGLSSLPAQPLGRFQATKIDKDDFFKLIQKIDQRTGSRTPPDRLERWFNSGWNEFSEKVLRIIESIGPEKPVPEVSNQERMLEELLYTVRRIDSGPKIGLVNVPKRRPTRTTISKGRPVIVLYSEEIYRALDTLGIADDDFYIIIDQYGINHGFPMSGDYSLQLSPDLFAEVEMIEGGGMLRYCRIKSVFRHKLS